MDGGLRIWNICNQCARNVYGTAAPNQRYADATARLLFGTAAQESALLWERQRSPRYDGQVGGFSKWQLETASIKESLAFLRSRQPLLKNATDFLFADPHAPVSWIDQMTLDAILWSMRMDDNDKLGCLFARIHYMWSTPAPIPYSLDEQAAYWKTYYNSPHGAGTTTQYIESWRRLCEPVIYAA
ncbi:MAG TPA: hypothetical protein P5318_20120 [Candidatus Hydrogenedentes bacterium]|nr:hypothetical protein [Candidatus Hydrogenedentota bacterium]